MPAPSSPDRRRSRIGRLIETDRSTEALAALLAEAAEPAVKTRAELARHLGVTRQTVGRWARVLECGAALDDALYALDRRDLPSPLTIPPTHTAACGASVLIGGRCNCGAEEAARG